MDEVTLRRMLGEILPITVLLDDDGGSERRWVTIDRAYRLDIIPGEGVRLATSGAMRWPISIVPVTVRLTHLQVLIRPIVVGSGAATRLLFRPQIEQADFERLPGFVDRGIVAIVNRALEARSDRLAWDVATSLGRQFELPATLVPLERARVDVVSATVTIDDQGIALGVTLDMSVARVGGETSPPVIGDESVPAG